MSFRALLVTKDDAAGNALEPVLSNFGLSLQCSGYPDALCLVTEQKFHAVLVDFDDPHSAALVFENLLNTRFQHHTVTVGLLADRGKVRHAFGHGAHFVLYKPVSEQEAASTLRAAVSLIKNERRTKLRVPVQVPVKLAGEDRQEIDGILLDLSEEGMDVLAAQPLYRSAIFGLTFGLPGTPTELKLQGEVVWANPNGESGIRFASNAEVTRQRLRAWLLDHVKPVPPPEPMPQPDCTLTDLSLGGCYMETPSPFPEGTCLILKLRTGQVQLQASGVVRVMHPAHGMGIEFAGATEQRDEIEAFIQSLDAGRENKPELRVSPCSIASTEQRVTRAVRDFEDPLLDLLRNHESFSQEKFLQALKHQRKSAAQA
jgi:CheY-like chemotaxis protein